MKYTKLEIAIDNLLDEMLYHVECYFKGDTRLSEVAYGLDAIKLQNPTEDEIEALHNAIDEHEDLWRYFGCAYVENNNLIVSYLL